MNRRGVWAVMLLMTLLVVMPKAWGSGRRRRIR